MTARVAWQGRPDEGPLTWDVVARRAIGYLAVVGLAALVVTTEVRQWRGTAGIVTLTLLVPALAGTVLARSMRGLPRRLPIVLVPLTVLAALVGVISVQGVAGCLLFMPISMAANRWPMRASLSLSIGGAAFYWGGWWAWHQTLASPWLLLALCGAYLGGLMDQAYHERVRHTAELLGQTERARQAESRSAALAERARIAREMHDVLAHSLAGLTVQLEAADALLEDAATDRAREVVRRCRRMAREGLAETRQAVLALREGGVGPLPGQLRDLLVGSGQAASALTVTGTAYELPAEVGFALYRIAQEALTNAVRHAPGAAVTIGLDYRPAEARLVVHNTAGTGVAAGAGSGYGVVGMAERVEPLGGSVSAGPVDDGWRVVARIPV